MILICQKCQIYFVICRKKKKVFGDKKFRSILYCIKQSLLIWKISDLFLRIKKKMIFDL